MAPSLENDPSLASALALALTGRHLELDSHEGLPGELAKHGFSQTELTRLRAQRQAAQLPWPYPVPLEVLRAVGFARFDAALLQAREALGLNGLHPARPARRALTRDEERLAADRPPHW